MAILHPGQVSEDGNQPDKTKVNPLILACHVENSDKSVKTDPQPVKILDNEDSFEWKCFRKILQFVAALLSLRAIP